MSERSNNNRRAGGAWPNGDANANDIQEEEDEEGTTTTGDAGTLPPPTSQAEEQDKIIIWGTDSQCDDPELAEFEMLECQELEAYLVGEGEDFGMLEPGTEPCDRAAVKPAPDKGALKEDGKTMQRGASEQEATASHVSGSRTRAEFSSETDVFVSCLSTMSSLGGSLASALDTAGRTQTTDHPSAPSGPYRTISEDFTTLSDRSRTSQPAEQHSICSGKHTIHRNQLDMNQNTTVLTEKGVLEAQKSLDVGGREEHTDNMTNDEHNQNLQQRYKQVNNTALSKGDHDAEVSANETKYESPTDHEAQRTASEHEEGPKMAHMCCQTEDISDMNDNPPTADVKGVQMVEPKAIMKQASFDKTVLRQGSSDHTLRKQPSFDKTLKKQGSFEHSLKKQGSFENSRSGSPSSLERRKPWGSPSRPGTPPSPKTSSSPRRRPPGSPAKAAPRDASQERCGSPQRSTSVLRQPAKVLLTSGIPKPAPPHQKEPEAKSFSPTHKPKNIRPKIITSVRKGPQVKDPVTDGGPYEVSTIPLRFSYAPPGHREPKVGLQPKSSPAPGPSNMLYDKYRQDMQKAGMLGSGIKPPGHTGPPKMGGKAVSFHGDLPEAYPHEEAAGLYRSPRALRPQLGLGAVASRTPSARVKGHQTTQRFLTPSQSDLGGAGTTHCYQEPTADPRRPGSETGPKSLLPKLGQSGLRPPGFSLPAARLAALEVVRCASASSVSSNQSSDSNHSDPCRPALRSSSGGDDAPYQRATAPPSDTSRLISSSSPLPPNAPAPQRRSLLAPHRSSPQASKKEVQRDVEMTRPPGSSPKRFAVVPPKPQSPVPGRGRSGAGRGTGQESERLVVQKLRERCEDQARQLLSLQAQLTKATLGLEVFAITTQHFCVKSERAVVKEKELSLELARIRDEVACSVERWEQVQQEKAALEQRVEREMQRLQLQQRAQLGALEERLRSQHATHTQRLTAQQHAQLEQLRRQQHEQMEEMNETHEGVLSEMEATHTATLDTLREEHTRTVKNLKMAHEQQRRSLEGDFEKLRLSLQDQVDTLTFQNRSLRDRAKRFEEALRRSTDEQIVDALAPYQHIEEDLKSLKDVLEMKNQQIHEQEQKISQLEKMAQKNVFLEERVQVLQQQNEDLRARIDKNLAMSRQLSEENANLQVNVEKESNEKKRLSRNNEELLWRLQTGDISPHMSPCSSPIHRAASASGSPSRPHPSTARPHSFHQ